MRGRGVEGFVQQILPVAGELLAAAHFRLAGAFAPAAGGQDAAIADLHAV